MSSAKSELQIPVYSVMNRGPIKISENETIHDAITKMCDHRVSALPVVNDDGSLLGIFTINDLLRLIRETECAIDKYFPMDDGSFLVADLLRDKLGADAIRTVMSKSTITADQEDTLQHVAQMMMKHQVHHIPVVNQDRLLVGMVSSIDFVRVASEGI